ncbi:MAG TPA: DUF899 family protein, partial [Pseudonocardia sp.]|nr:DUF899 family protein [Pseudonocardia sp.]
MNLPTVVSAAEWAAASKQLLVREKELSRAMDAVNAERRRLPMTPFDGGYRFEGPAGEATL